MNAPLLDAKINAYKKRIKKLDEIAMQVPKAKQVQYQALRKRFEQRLKAWQKTLGSDLAVFNHNVSEGYDELEAYLIAAK